MRRLLRASPCSRKASCSSFAELEPATAFTLAEALSVPQNIEARGQMSRAHLVLGSLPV